MKQHLIDESCVCLMAREYQMNPSQARKLLEQAREVPALRLGRMYEKKLKKHEKIGRVHE